MNLKCFFSCVTSVLFIFSSVLMRVKGESSKNGWLRLFDCNKLIITRLEEYNKDPHTKDTISSFCDGLWLRFSMWLYNGWRVSVNDIQEEFILHKIWERERHTGLLYCLENRINYHHNKCLLSSSVGVCVYKCVLVLVRLWERVWVWDIWWDDSFTKWGYFESSLLYCRHV